MKKVLFSPIGNTDPISNLVICQQVFSKVFEANS